MEEKFPVALDLLLVEKCNMRCKMCHMWKYGDSTELTFSQCEALLNDLEKLVGGRPLEINLSGGEPLLRKDILKIIRLCADNGFSTSMATNGYLLDEETVKNLFDAGLTKIILSLASMNREIHDFLRGVDYSYDRIMGAIGHLRKYWQKRQVYINTIIKEINLDDIVELAKWVQGDKLIAGIGFQALAQPFYAPYDELWHKKEEYADIWPRDIKKVRSVLDKLIEFKKLDYKIGNSIPQLQLFKEYYGDPQGLIRKSRCNFGDHIINVNRIGEVMLCPFIGAVGNIKNDSIINIWRSESADNARRMMYECKLICNNIINCWFREREEF